MRTPSVRTWFPEEIDRTTRSVLQASADVASHIPGKEMELYSRGFLDAINHMRTAVGLPPLRLTAGSEDRAEAIPPQT